MRKIALALALFVFCLPAHGTEGTWTDIGPALRARLVAGDLPAPDGTLLVGLELDLAGGARTYWSTPGEAGIGTVLDPAASQGVALEEVLWPLPEVLVEAGLTEYVYRTDIVIPLRVRVTAPAGELRLAFSGGVCTDICMPVSANLSLALPPAAPDPANSTWVSLALLAVPVPWTGRGLPFSLTECGPDGVTLSDLDPAILPQSLILEEAGSPALYVPGPEAGRFERLSRSAPGDNPVFRAMFSSRSGAFVVETRCPSTAARG